MTTDTLPCGRDPADVWDDAADGGIDGHEQTCPYCQEVISQYQSTAGPLSRWREQPVAAPPALLDRVLATVRAGLRTRNYLPIVSPHGPVNLNTLTAQAALRWSIDQLLDARAQHCAIRPQPIDTAPGATETQAARPTVDIELSLAAPANRDLRAIAAQARDILRTVATETLSLDVGSIDVHIADLYEPPPAATDDETFENP